MENTAELMQLGNTGYLCTSHQGRGQRRARGPCPPLVNVVDFLKGKTDFVGTYKTRVYGFNASFSSHMNILLSGLCTSFSKVTRSIYQKCSVDLKYAKNALAAPHFPPHSAPKHCTSILALRLQRSKLRPRFSRSISGPQCKILATRLRHMMHIGPIMSVYFRS